MRISLNPLEFIKFVGTVVIRTVQYTAYTLELIVTRQGAELLAGATLALAHGLVAAVSLVKIALTDPFIILIAVWQIGKALGWWGHTDLSEPICTNMCKRIQAFESLALEAYKY